MRPLFRAISLNIGLQNQSEQTRVIASCSNTTGISAARCPAVRLFLWLPSTYININGILRGKEGEPTAKGFKGDGREITLSREIESRAPF